MENWLCVWFVGCLDMLATDGLFTFVASKPQLACAAFIIAEPSEVISLELSDVSIDCSAGDFIKVGTHTKNSPHTYPTPLLSERQGLQGFFRFKLWILFHLLPVHLKLGQTGLRQRLRAKHHTGCFLHWSHYSEQEWEEKALVLKPSLPVQISVHGIGKGGH